MDVCDDSVQELLQGWRFDEKPHAGLLVSGTGETIDVTVKFDSSVQNRLAGVTDVQEKAVEDGSSIIDRFCNSRLSDDLPEGLTYDAVFQHFSGVDKRPYKADHRRQREQNVSSFAKTVEQARRNGFGEEETWNVLSALGAEEFTPDLKPTRNDDTEPLKTLIKQVPQWFGLLLFVIIIGVPSMRIIAEDVHRMNMWMNNSHQCRASFCWRTDTEPKAERSGVELWYCPVHNPVVGYVSRWTELGVGVLHILCYPLAFCTLFAILIVIVGPVLLVMALLGIAASLPRRLRGKSAD
ncbi:MAG TPA: hypothetical protein EYG03_06530 [Planctomycetes bacterium]|nr:hypothetical protein [Fuerstiella sp.]HIK91623.1 hypothetical protein [Planctomycetota bacterium]